MPLRFHRVAPWFGVLAAAQLAAGGSASWTTRWQPETLGATHLLTLGFLATVMLGSLYQVVPVLTGARLPATERCATFVLVALAAGALALALGLGHGVTAALWCAVAVLGLAFGVFVAQLATVLGRRLTGEIALPIRLAGAAMLATVALGLWLALGRAAPALGIPFRLWTDLHAATGLGGQVGLLVMAVGSQVVPMFHVTPGYPRLFVRGCALAVAAGLVLFAVAPARLGAATALLAAGTTVFAVVSSVVLARRRRRIDDATVRFWQLAFASAALAAVAVWLRAVDLVRLPLVPAGAEGLAIGVVALVGGALSAVIGMQQKIVPFLVFLHRQRGALGDPRALASLPTMLDIVPPGRSWCQLWLHAAAYAAALVAAAFPVAGPAAAVLLALDFAWLGRTIHLAARFAR